MEHTGNRSAKCQQKTMLYLAIGCCIPLLTYAIPNNLQSCDSLQFEYNNPGNSSVSLHRCLDVCPPTKNALNNRIFCCRNCPEYCARCLECSSTKPSDIGLRESSSKISPEQHPTQSSPTSAESSTLDTSRHILPIQLDIYRHEKAEWQRKEIVYIAVISCLVFALITMALAFLIHYKFTSRTTKDREGSNSTSRSEVSDAQHDRQGLLNNQRPVLDQKKPVEHEPVSQHQHQNSSLCAMRRSDSIETTEKRKISHVLNANNTPLKDLETSSSQCRHSLMSIPHTLLEDSSRDPLTVIDCDSCSELQALQ